MLFLCFGGVFDIVISMFRGRDEIVHALVFESNSYRDVGWTPEVTSAGLVLSLALKSVITCAVLWGC